MGGPQARDRMRTVGAELVELLDATVDGLALDDRDQDMERAQDEEEQLARMLSAAVWYTVAYGNPYGSSTPRCSTPRSKPPRSSPSSGC
jgi:hypothetical protein